MMRRKNEKERLEPQLGSLDKQTPAVDLRMPLKPERIKKTKSSSSKYEEDHSKQDFEIKRSVIILASLLLLISTVIFAVDQLFSPDTFEIEELSIIADLEHLTADSIRTQVLPLIQNNYFAVDLKKVERKVEAIDWVDQVSVRRQWPRSIHIRLTEQKPVAHWGKQGYLNERAQSFTVQQFVDLEGLPYLDGPQGTQKQILKQYRKWKKLLDKENLQLESLMMTPRYAYEAQVSLPRDQQKLLTQAALMAFFDEKKQPVPVLDWQRIKPFVLTLQLGKDDVEQRLLRFSAAFPDAFNDQVLKVKTVDLRYPNGFAVRWSDSELPQDFLNFAVTVDQKI